MKNKLKNVGFIIVDLFTTTKGTTKFHENKTAKVIDGEVLLYGEKYPIISSESKAESFYEMLNGKEEVEMKGLLDIENSGPNEGNEILEVLPGFLPQFNNGQENSDTKLYEAIVMLWSKRNEITYKEATDVWNNIYSL